MRCRIRSVSAIAILVAGVFSPRVKPLLIPLILKRKKG